MRWPSKEVEYQYLMENIFLKQIKNKSEVKISIVGLNIRNDERRFFSDEAWKTNLKNRG